MNHRQVLFSLLMVAACGCASSTPRASRRMTATTAPMDRAYRIRLEKPAKVGDRERVEILLAEVTTDRTRWSGYPDPFTTTYTRGARLMGDFEITGVDERGNATALACTVDSCSKFTGDDGEDEETLLEKGDRLVAREGRNSTSFTVNGKKPGADVEMYLSLLMRLESKARAISQDDVFGTSERERVGQSWPINVAAMVRNYELYDSKLLAQDVHGSVKLVGVEEVHGEPCLRIESDVEMKKFTPLASTTTTRSSRSSSASPSSPYTSGSMTGHIVWWRAIDPESVVEQHVSSYERHYKLQGASQRRRYSTERTTQTETATRVFPTTAPGGPLPGASTHPVQSVSR